jgi:hypothetical protein
VKTTLPDDLALRNRARGGANGDQHRFERRGAKTRKDGVFALKLDEGASLAMLVSIAQDMFPGVSTEDIGVWPGGALRFGGRGGAAESKVCGMTGWLWILADVVGVAILTRDGAFSPSSGSSTPIQTESGAIRGRMRACC